MKNTNVNQHYNAVLKKMTKFIGNIDVKRVFGGLDRSMVGCMFGWLDG